MLRVLPLTREVTSRAIGHPQPHRDVALNRHADHRMSFRTLSERRRWRGCKGGRDVQDGPRRRQPANSSVPSGSGQPRGEMAASMLSRAGYGKEAS